MIGLGLPLPFDPSSIYVNVVPPISLQDMRPAFVGLDDPGAH